MKAWLKRLGRMLSKHYMGILMVAAVITSYAAFFAAMSDTAYWKIVATTPEPKCCVVCEDGNGNRCHAPVLVNLSMRSVLMGSEYPVMDTPHFLFLRSSYCDLGRGVA